VIDILSEWGSLYVLLKDGRVRLEGDWMEGREGGGEREGRDGKREEGRRIRSIVPRPCQPRSQTTWEENSTFLFPQSLGIRLTLWE